MPNSTLYNSNHIECIQLLLMLFITFFAISIDGLSIGVLLAMSSRSLLSFLGIASFSLVDKWNLAADHRTAATA